MTLFELWRPRRVTVFVHTGMSSGSTRSTAWWVVVFLVASMRRWTRGREGKGEEEEDDDEALELPLRSRRRGRMRAQPGPRSTDVSSVASPDPTVPFSSRNAQTSYTLYKRIIHPYPRPLSLALARSTRTSSQSASQREFLIQSNPILSLNTRCSPPLTHHAV